VVVVASNLATTATVAVARGQGAKGSATHINVAGTETSLLEDGRRGCRQPTLRVKEQYNMRYFKSLGLCLVAVFALGAVMASSAFAEALFLFPKEGAAKLQDFSSKSGGGFLVAKSGATVECTSATNTGEVENKTDRTEKVLIVFKGCEIEVLAKRHICTTAGQASGVIKTFQLNGNLGLLNKTGEAEKTGLVLKAEEGLSENPKNLFAEFECANVGKVRVKGKKREGSEELGGIIAEILSKSIEKLIDPGEAGLLTYKKGKEAWEQQWQSLTVLGALVDALLLESSTNNKEFELSGLEEKEDVEIFFLESVIIDA
jgi:hypothetical protein